MENGPFTSMTLPPKNPLRGAAEAHQHGLRHVQRHDPGGGGEGHQARAGGEGDAQREAGVRIATWAVAYIGVPPWCGRMKKVGVVFPSKCWRCGLTLWMTMNHVESGMLFFEVFQGIFANKNQIDQ